MRLLRVCFAVTVSASVAPGILSHLAAQDYNQLTSIPNGAFAGLPSLSSLNLVRVYVAEECGSSSAGLPRYARL